MERTAVQMFNFPHLEALTFSPLPQPSEFSVSISIVLIIEEHSAPLVNTHVSLHVLLFTIVCASMLSTINKLTEFPGKFCHYQ